MNTNERKNLCDEGLSPVIDQLENDVAGWFKESPNALRLLLVLAGLFIVSPIAVFWLGGRGLGKDWGELVKNVVESGAVLAAVFAVVKWVNERRDRSTEVLLKLDVNFQDEKVKTGKKLLEQGDCGGEPSDVDTLDALLRFYVVLYGVLRAKQVPERSLSICFRYWLAYYFRNDRPKFRRFLNANYPTLKLWLKQDCEAGCPFFRPDDFWKAGEIETAPEKLEESN